MRVYVMCLIHSSVAPRGSSEEASADEALFESRDQRYSTSAVAIDRPPDREGTTDKLSI